MYLVLAEEDSTITQTDTESTTSQSQIQVHGMLWYDMNLIAKGI
jgi:hypothetical protein